MRCLGVDYGLSKIGIALGDSETRISSPIGIIAYSDLFNDLRKIIKEEGIDLVVVGLPLNVDGSYSEQTKKTLEFVEDLKEIIKVELVDERFTSQESLSLQGKGGKIEEDALAAMLILDQFFSEL